MAATITTLLAGVCLICLPSHGSASHHVRLNSLDDAYDALAIRRATQIARLNEYAARGVFPKNRDFPGELVPYFVDADGTACAVGHLMQLDGELSVVAGVAAKNNHIRIEDVRGGPVLAWMLNSGLTQQECSLIQPTYATIESYRRSRQWQSEIERLQQHFAVVEASLRERSGAGLRQALMARVDAQLKKSPNDPALAIKSLQESLASKEPVVRIAAAYAIAKATGPKRSEKVHFLEPNLADDDLDVRFWTAVALQEVGAASIRGKREIDGKTLPIFLDSAKQASHETRLAGLIQLAAVAPMTMGTNKQLRIMPEIRREMVDACGHPDDEVAGFAKSVLQSFRWQRIAYESQRMRHQYLAGSADLEALAAEAASLGREFAIRPASLEYVARLRSYYDVENSITYLLPNATETPLPTADSPEEAKDAVDQDFRSTYEKQRTTFDSPWPFWEIVGVETDPHGIFYAVESRMTDPQHKLKQLFLIPGSRMLASANKKPYYWFVRNQQPAASAEAGFHQMTYSIDPGAEVVFGDLARSEPEAFAAACDLFGYFLAHHSQLLIDREVATTDGTLSWIGRLATVRQGNPRFFGEGVGSHSYGGGGWDLHRITFECDIPTGKLTIKAEPLVFPLEPLPESDLAPAWMTTERELMGWRRLPSIDFFGDALFPPEYHEAVEAFDPDNADKSQNLLYRRHAAERNLPSPRLMLALLYAKAGRDELAQRYAQMAGGESRGDPVALTNVARWEMQAGTPAVARQHAEAALALWPECSAALEVLSSLEASQDTPSRLESEISK